MAIQEELAAKLARQVAVTFSEEVYGPDGPELDCDIDEIEDLLSWSNDFYDLRFRPVWPGTRAETIFNAVVGQ